MRKAIALVAVLALAATPALAGLTPSSISPTGVANLTRIPGAHTVGIYTPASGGGIFSNYATPANASDIRTATFAFHWPYVTTVTGIQFWSSLSWDSSEITILSTTTTGSAWSGSNNFPNATTTATSRFAWSQQPQNAGVVTLGNVLGSTGGPLWVNPTFTSTSVIGSQIMPFMKVQYHVDNPNGDGALDLVIGSAALLFHSGGTSTWWTGGNIGATSFGVDITPEPASLSLLALGFATTGFGVWRRRRR